MIKMLKFCGSLLLSDLFDGHAPGFQFLRELFLNEAGDDFPEISLGIDHKSG